MKRLAIIGVGRIGQIHVAAIGAHPRLELALVADANTAAARAVADATGAQVGDLADMIADHTVDGLVIAGPTDMHLDAIVSGVEAGKAVFCEKPVDLDYTRAVRAQARVEAAGPPVLIGFNRRFDPHFAALQKRLRENAVGELESLHIISHDPAPPPLTYLPRSGGLFKDMAIHDFDMARWLLDDPITSVFAAASCLVDPGIGAAGDIDTAKIVLRTKGGKLCVISNSRRSGYGYDQRIEAFGSSGALRVDNVLETQVSRWNSDGASSDTFQNFFLDRYARAYEIEIDHFARVLHDEEAPRATFADGIASLALAEAADQAVRSGAAVPVEGL